MTQITDQLQNTAIKVIHSRITDVLLNTVYEIANLSEEYADTEIYGEVIASEDMQSEIDKVRKLFLKLSANLAKPLEERSEYTKEISDTREGLMKKHRAVFAYKTLCGRLEDANSRRSKLSLAETDEIKDALPDSNEELVDSLIGKISHSYDIPYTISMVLSKVPLRMARTKYDELMERSMELLFTGMSSAFIENCKYTFSTQLAPQAAEGYGKYFSLIAQSLDEMSKFDAANAGEDEAEEYSDMLDDLSEKIDNTETILNVCYNIVNYLDILSVYAMDEAYATYDNLIIKDLLHSCEDMLGSDTPEMYTETIIDKSTDIIEELFGEGRDYEDTLQDAIQNLSDKQKAALPDDTKLVLHIYNSIVYKYMLEITDGLTALDETQMKPAPIEDVYKAVEDMVQLINDSCESLSPAEKKLVKQHFISQVPIDISPNELHDYLLYAFEGINDKKVRIVAFGDILEALDDMDLLDLETEHEDGECGCGHHHGHDHDCNCGHHHDNDHECECGHHHDHGHECGCDHHHKKH